MASTRVYTSAVIAAGLLVALVSARPAAAARSWVALDNHPWPPFYIDDPAQPGFLSEVMQLCVPQAGMQPRFDAVAPARQAQSLRSGNIDVHVMPYDQSHEPDVLYGRVPLFSDGYRVVVRAGGTEAATLADLDKLKLGDLRGSHYAPDAQAYVDRRVGEGTVVEGESLDEMLRLLLDGTIDGLLVSPAGASWLARSWNAAERIAVLSIDLGTDDYFAVMSQKSGVKDKRGFLDRFDACVMQLQQDGRYAQLKAKYGLQ
jgi:ABC-type amino acid transport substrate-binding protein